MRREGLAIASGTLLVLVLAGCGEISLDSKKETKLRPAATAAETGDIELPVADSAGEPYGEGDLVEVRALQSGSVWLLGEERDEDSLAQELIKLADAKRDMGHPCQPSEQGILIRADRRAPWKAVLGAFRACDEPAVRLYKIYFAAMSRAGGEEKVLQAFLPKDYWARARIRLATEPRITVRMGGPIPGEHTRVRVLGVPITLDEAGEARVRELVAGIHSRGEDLRGEILARDDVPFGDVVRIYDTLVSAGVTMHGNDMVPRREVEPAGAFAIALRSSEVSKVEEAVREAMGNGGPELPGGLFDEETGLRQEAYDYLYDKVGAASSLHFFESLVVKEPGNRDRVRELLARQEFVEGDLLELTSKIEPSFPLLVALARFYMACGMHEDLLRALTLLQLVSRDPDDRFGERWWHVQLLTLRLFDQYCRDFKDDRAREIALEMVKAWRNLGVLEKSPYLEEILRLEQESKR